MLWLIIEVTQALANKQVSDMADLVGKTITDDADNPAVVLLLSLDRGYPYSYSNEPLVVRCSAILAVRDRDSFEVNLIKKLKSLGARDKYKSLADIEIQVEQIGNGIVANEEEHLAGVGKFPPGSQLVFVRLQARVPGVMLSDISID